MLIAPLPSEKGYTGRKLKVRDEKCAARERREVWRVPLPSSVRFETRYRYFLLVILTTLLGSVWASVVSSLFDFGIAAFRPSMIYIAMVLLACSFRLEYLISTCEGFQAYQTAPHCYYSCCCCKIAERRSAHGMHDAPIYSLLRPPYFISTMSRCAEELVMRTATHAYAMGVPRAGTLWVFGRAILAHAHVDASVKMSSLLLPNDA